MIKNQKQLFEEIWEERPHVSELTGKRLLPKGHPMWHWQFAHILPKGSYPLWKLQKENIMLMTPDEHENQENSILFKKKQDKLRRKFYEENRVRKI